ncbi:Asp-tRNA(Asn)/Glu-tRNA(Gln) amidotransferase subunit GatA [Aridibaculum aurantiacum]|uniref:Asp-tRNA(Asn)/Glu-tRNA(Gln) amidotransferase subunit GatA n=1 Tax=Aridibaculum aurantiacum TaxID=2810307 RepID=UPI001F623D1F|nr:Asp-tRNA(Asn)/Glu-tRNA(Gln) amidotransferase subunit GatA [Aridibaculum aurantiacum]
MKNGTTTCVDAVLFYLQQIKEHQHLNAWLEVYEEEALARARQLDEKRSAGEGIGALHGVVVGLKDVICFTGHKVSAASAILAEYTSIYNATATERLLHEDAIIIGRQNCDEFAMGSSNENSAFGPVLNAADLTRVPGGSSGGSAVAVQAGMCMVSLGSDTGGSVRQPADFCGVVGFKPTYGTISRYGLIAYASSFDQIGIFANTVDDVALVLDTISGADDYDSTMIQKPATISYPVEIGEQKQRYCYFKNALEHPSLNGEISTHVNSFTEILTAAGHTVEAIDFELLDYIIPTYYILTTAEASSNLSRYDGVRFGKKFSHSITDISEAYKGVRSEGFGAEVKRRILLGTFVLSAGYYDAYFTKAQQVRQLLKTQTDTIFQQYDAILLPTVPSPAFKLGEKKDPVEMFLADIYTVYANLVGIPAISIPLFKTADNLPFGLQVMTSRHNDLPLLAFAKQMMDLKEGKI